MLYKNFGENYQIAAIGLGTRGIGGKREKDDSDDIRSIKAIKEAIKLGYTHIDTAEIYGLGHTEELVGEAIQEFDRKNLFISSKVAGQNLKYEDVILSTKESIKRLQTPYIDLHMIHWPNPNIDIKETMKAFDFLIKEKLIKHIGVSNFSVEELKEAQKHTQNKIVANQIEYNLITRSVGEFKNCSNIESEIIPYCQKNNITVVAYRPIERGMLGKDYPILNQLSEKYKKTNIQIAINWLIHKENIITIPKSTDTEHLKENIGALGWKLSEEDMKWLDESDFTKQ